MCIRSRSTPAGVSPPDIFWITFFLCTWVSRDVWQMSFSIFNKRGGTDSDRGPEELSTLKGEHIASEIVQLLVI